MRIMRMDDPLNLSTSSHQATLPPPLTVVLYWFEITASCIVNLKVQFEAPNSDNNFNHKAQCVKKTNIGNGIPTN